MGARPPPAPAPPGVLVGIESDRYRVDVLLGEGARKRVYRAYDSRLDRDVALAIIKTDGLDESGIARVQREARAMGRLGDHPNIVTVYDVGDDDGIPYIVSELLTGGDLEQLLRGAPDGRLPIDEAVRIVDEVARALQHAHEHGVVHRDLKPSNVWLTDAGTARLGDFGLAIALGRSRLTSEGMIVGTVAYLAPEQAIGRVPDTRSDLYALGAVLYELVCGRPPFVGDDAVTVISQHLHNAPVAPSWHNADVSPALDALILGLLAKAPEDRFPDAAAVREALALVRENAPGDSVTGANPLDRLAGGVFVGREPEVESLRAAFDDALAGRGHLVLLAGEPGIGKTRTADELSTYARLRGAQVLWGRCHEGEGAPAYWPWVQVVRGYAHDRDRSDLRSELGSGASVIAQVVPEIAQHLPDIEPAPALEPEQARFRLFDSIAAFLKNAAQRQPLVLLLDDLHWADEPSLLLLRHLTPELAVGRLLVVATYRDVELGRHHPLAATLGELVRHGTTQRIALRGLSEEDVGRYIEITTARTPPPSLTTAVFQETEGNPFFVAEVVRLLATEGRLDQRNDAHWSVSIPQGVREVVGRRLEQLTEKCNEVLAVAAVIGREFASSVIADVAEIDHDDVLAACEEAEGARIIDPSSGGRAYRFSHALIRETLYDELPQSRRIKLHRSIGEVLEALPRELDQASLAELAHHFSRAAPGGDVDRAVTYARRAAVAADASLAYEEAARLYRLALDNLELTSTADDRTRFELMMALGAANKRAANIDDSRDAFRAASTIAEGLGDAEAMAEGALGFARPGLRAGLPDHDLIEMLEHALAHYPVEATPMRARLLGRLAMEFGFLDMEKLRRAGAEAMSVAEQVGDPRALAMATLVSYGDLYGTADQVDAMERAMSWATGAGDLELASFARLYWVCGLVYFGRWTEAEEQIEQFGVVADQLRQPFFYWHRKWFETSRALYQGRFDEGLELAAEARLIGDQVSTNDALQGYVYQRFVSRRSPADLDFLATQSDELIEAIPELLAWRAVRGVVAIEQGDLARARELLEEMVAAGTVQIPEDAFQVPAVALAAEVAWSLGNRQQCAALRDVLATTAGKIAVFGASAAYLGSIDRYRGQAAAGAGELDDALTHFDQALEQHVLDGGRPWVARLHLDRARVLRERDGPGDRQRAIAAATEAIEIGRELGMTLLVESALSLKLAVQGVSTEPSGGSVHAVALAVSTDRPDLLLLVPHAEAGGTVTILFTDIESSTALAEELGDARWLEVLRAHNTLVRAEVQAHGGTEVKSRGDGFMLAFPSARRGVRCAIAVQRSLASRPIDVGAGNIRVRIGLHTGEAMREERDFYGRHVNLAARVAEAAAGEEILVSSLTRDLLAGTEGVDFGEPRFVALKGVTGEQQVVPVLWRSTGANVANATEHTTAEGEDQRHASA